MEGGFISRYLLRFDVQATSANADEGTITTASSSLYTASFVINNDNYKTKHAHKHTKLQHTHRNQDFTKDKQTKLFYGLALTSKYLVT